MFLLCGLSQISLVFRNFLRLDFWVWYGQSCHQETQSRLVPLWATHTDWRELGSREMQTLLQLLVRAWLCKLMSPCCIWNTCHALFRYPDDFEGNSVWVHGVVRRCACITSGLCSLRWDASYFLLTLGFFQVPWAVPSSCLSSAQRSQLKASLGLAWFRVVYGQAKWNCPMGSLREPLAVGSATLWCFPELMGIALFIF